MNLSATGADWLKRAITQINKDPAKFSMSAWRTCLAAKVCEAWVEDSKTKSRFIRHDSTLGTTYAVVRGIVATPVAELACELVGIPIDRTGNIGDHPLFYAIDWFEPYRSRYLAACYDPLQRARIAIEYVEWFIQSFAKEAA